MRRVVLPVALCMAASLAWSVPTRADTPLPPEPQACDTPSNSTTLFAVPLGNGRIGYGRSPDSAKIPGPTLQLTEGECISVTLVNDTRRRVSLHVHGLAYTVNSDGTPTNESCVGPGGTKTYIFEAMLPKTRADGTIAPGSAGYWPYHDHCAGSPHGTGGIDAGLFGAIIVRRPGDPVPDRKPFVVVMKGTTINLKKAPNTPTFRANEGERVEFVVLGMGDEFHTFHLHGHRWADNRTGNASTLTDATQVIDNRTVGPADSFGFQIIAGEDSGPGAWMYHCHVQFHSDVGMSGMFVVRTPTGELTDSTRAALEEWRAMKHEGHHP